MIETAFFLILAAVCVIASILVITQRNPVASAIYLIFAFFSLAGIFLLLNAQFIAITQVLVYAGAIMVLFLFVIMLLNLEKEDRRITRVSSKKIAGVAFGVILAVQLGMIFHSVFQIGREGNFPPAKVEAMGNTETLARVLFTHYLLPFEITSILLLVAIIGAVILAKREV